MQIIPPCFCLGVTINMSELMCFQSLTSFQVSFFFLPGSISSQIHKTLGYSDFIKRASTRVFKLLKVWGSFEVFCWEIVFVDRYCQTVNKHVGTHQECRTWGKDPGVDLFALSRYGHCSGHNCELRWFFFNFEVCALVLSIIVLKYNYDKCRQTIW